MACIAVAGRGIAAAPLPRDAVADTGRASFSGKMSTGLTVLTGDLLDATALLPVLVLGVFPCELFAGFGGANFVPVLALPLALACSRSCRCEKKALI